MPLKVSKFFFGSVPANDKQTTPQFNPTFMKDAECAETSEKFIENWGDLWYKNDHSSKNKNGKFVFSFDSAHSASFM